MTTKTILACLIAMASASGAVAQEFVLPSSDEGLRISRNIELDGLTFDVYRPANAAAAPVMIFANIGHRGFRGWPIYTGWARAAGQRGFAAVTYDSTDDDPEAALDRLIAELRTKHRAYGIDPESFVIWGGSSNVGLALPFVMEPRRGYVRAALIYYGWSDVEVMRTDLPVHVVRAGLDSKSLNEGLDGMMQRALAQNAPWTIENHGSGYHGFEVLNDDALSRVVIERSLDFAARAVSRELSVAYVSAADDASLGAAFARGDWPAAIRGYQSITAERPADAEAHRRLGLSLFGAGRNAEALSALERAYELGRRGALDTAVPAARAAALAGNVERAVHWLDRALGSPHVSLAQIEQDPAFASLIAHPAFQEMRARRAGG